MDKVAGRKQNANDATNQTALTSGVKRNCVQVKLRNCIVVLDGLMVRICKRKGGGDNDDIVAF